MCGIFVMTSSVSKLALMIDGPNAHATARSLQLDLDYKLLLKKFQERGTLVRAFYYTAVIEDQEYSSVRPLLDWLDYNGYTVVTKSAKEFTDDLGRRKIKGNMAVELAVDAMELAPQIDELILFSGDGDFRSLVEAVQRRGVRVRVVSTLKCHPAMIADELRRQADIFEDLDDMRAAVSRPPLEGLQAREPQSPAARPVVSPRRQREPSRAVNQTRPTQVD